MTKPLSKLQIITLRSLDQHGGWASVHDLNVGLNTLRALHRRGLVDNQRASMTRWERWQEVFRINDAGKKALEGGGS